MQDSNTIRARHFRINRGNLTLDGRDYHWHIPKNLRSENIKKGDVVLVRARGNVDRVVVMDSFRENIEETGKKYNVVVQKVSAPLVTEAMKDESKVKISLLRAQRKSESDISNREKE
jgi:bifunctional DNA-binding transcriptional regulator/antitoxin component of YhaV-PrlF toxin-antitoxin module